MEGGLVWWIGGCAVLVGSCVWCGEGWAGDKVENVGAGVGAEKLNFW